MPSNYEEYISEWKALHPGWEVKRWDETNSPMDLSYLKNAQACGKWANMSNLVRFHALLNEGGIYLDTDMKVIKPLDDLLTNECFMGFEDGEGVNCSLWVNNAIIGAAKKNVFISRCYEALLESFDGSEDANLSAPRLVTRLLKDEYGLCRYGYQILQGITLYPQSYFYPVHYNEPNKLSNLEEYIDDSTVAVHMWGRSWLTSVQLLKMLDDLRYNYNIEVSKNHIYQTTWHSIKNTGDSLFLGLESSAPLNAQPTLIDEIKERVDSIGDRIGDVQKHYSQFSAEIERLVSAQQTFEEKILEKENRIAALNNRLNEASKELASRLDLIEQLQEKHRSAQLDNVTLVGALKTENELLKQNLCNKEAQIAQLTISIKEIEAGLQLQIRLLTEHKITLQQSLEEKISQLQDTAASLTKTIESKNVLAKEKVVLISALGRKEQEADSATLKLELLQREKDLLIADAKLQEVELQRLRKVGEETAARIANLEGEYQEYRLVQERNNTELIAFLQNKVDNHHRDIKWYQATYENRNLFGILKDKFLKSFYILRK